jgi:N-methylhydantoinase B/oxoprolinase/acetone carboxylase alpha subunit
MIESGRQFAVNKIKASFFPGRYRALSVYDIPNASQPIRIPVDYMVIMPLEARIEKQGHMVFDWDGTSASGFHSNNSSYCASLGNHIYTILQDSMTDGFFNQGMAYGFELHIPKGTVLNPERDRACSVWTTIVVGMASGLSPVLARAFYAKGVREEGFASKSMNNGMFAGGIDNKGQVFAAFNFESNCSGSGAQSNYDGLSAANSVWNPEVNMSDCETFEHIWPLMWLGRGVYKDGGGYGRRRGGAGVESMYVIENNPKYVESGSISSGDAVFCSPGLFGGYPAPAAYRYTYRNTNYRELIEKRLPLPHAEGEDPSNPELVRRMKGNLVRGAAQDASRPYAPFDLIDHHSGGGGGWGDPLNRDLADIRNDLADGLITEWCARNVYKVAFAPGTLQINEDETCRLREEERKARIAKATPVSKYVVAQREKILSGNVPQICRKSFNDIFRSSDKFLSEFRECWGLPEGFTAI